MSPPERICATCGRAFSWRRAWADRWDEIRYCSRGCRTHRPGPLDRALEAEILAHLSQQPRAATVTPEQIARAVRPRDWSAHTERVRRAARRLVAAGAVELLQQGQVVDPSSARGAILIRRTSRALPPADMNRPSR